MRSILVSMVRNFSDLEDMSKIGQVKAQASFPPFEYWKIKLLLFGLYFIQDISQFKSEVKELRAEVKREAGELRAEVKREERELRGEMKDFSKDLSEVNAKLSYIIGFLNNKF